MAEILVVDDEEPIRNYLRSTLRRQGHRVECAEDGLLALAAVRKRPNIDLLITDVVMPRLDGTRLLAAMRQDSRLTGIPAIIMSGSVGMREIRNLLEAGATRFLAKPLTQEILMREVSSVLEPRSSLRGWVPPSLAQPRSRSEFLLD